MDDVDPHGDCIGALPFGPFSSESSQDLFTIESYGHRHSARSTSYKGHGSEGKRSRETEQGHPSRSHQRKRGRQNRDLQTVDGTMFVLKGRATCIHARRSQRKRSRQQARTTRTTQSVDTSTGFPHSRRQRHHGEQLLKQRRSTSASSTKEDIALNTGIVKVAILQCAFFTRRNSAESSETEGQKRTQHQRFGRDC